VRRRTKRSSGLVMLTMLGGLLSSPQAQAAPVSAPQGPPGPVPEGWILITPGSFLMGSLAGEPGRDEDERQHRVTLTRKFLMKATEVTQGEYTAVMGRNPSRMTSCGASCPVENVSWRDAVRYVNALSRKEGRPACYALKDGQVRFRGLDCPGYRLPTEAEWEYAARAGTPGAVYRGSFEILGANHAPGLDGLAWYGGNSGVTYAGGTDCSTWSEAQYPAERCGPHPVAQKTANPWGLYDMLGNVWEWCHDGYAPYGDGPVQDPTGPSRATVKVFRGGSWFDDARDVRAANRGRITPTYRDGDLGFRPVRTVL